MKLSVIIHDCLLIALLFIKSSFSFTIPLSELDSHLSSEKETNYNGKGNYKFLIVLGYPEVDSKKPIGLSTEINDFNTETSLPEFDTGFDDFIKDITFQLENAINMFNESYEIFNDSTISASIGIVVLTQFEDIGLREWFCKLLLPILENERDSFPNDNIFQVFHKVILNSQVYIVNSKNYLIFNAEKMIDSHLVQHLNYTQIDPEIVERIEKRAFNQLRNYTQCLNNNIEISFAKDLLYGFKKYFDTSIKNLNSLKELINLYYNLTHVYEFENLLHKINESILIDKDKRNYILKKNAVHLFSQLFQKLRDKFSFLKVWINNELDILIRKKILSAINVTLNNKIKEIPFNSIFYEVFKKYLLKKMHEPIPLKKIHYLIDLIKQSKISSYDKNSNLSLLLDIFDESILDQSTKELILTKHSDISFLLESLKYFNETQYFIYKSDFNYLIDLDLTFDSFLRNQYYDTITNSICDLKHGILTCNVYYARLSTIVNKIQSLNDFEFLKAVNIYATESFEIDVDFKLDKNKYTFKIPDLNIIAPTIDIGFENYVFNLTCEHVPGFPDDRSKADNGRFPGQDGSDGKPGLPGCSGGNLFIFASKILREENLRFISNGGKGGQGQDGGDGAEGAKGRDALFSDVEELNLCDIDKMSDKDHQDKYCNPCSRMCKYRTYVFQTPLNPSITTHCGQVGEEGGKGGDAGQAGCGGTEGNDGKFYLIVSSNISKIIEPDTHKITNNGNSGNTGKKGIGGRKGDTACRTLETQFLIFFYEFKLSSNYLIDKDTIILSSERGPDGNNATSECNYQGRQNFEIKNEVNVYDILTEYLKFASSTKSSVLMKGKFIEDLINLKLVKPNIASLLERLEILSSNRHLLNILQNTISELHTDKSTNENEKMVLKYINATIMSTINRYKTASSSVLVVDVHKFLQITRSKITEWKDIIKQNIADIYTLKYQHSLRKKITEANELVILMRADVENYDKDLKNGFVKILNEIDEMKNNSNEKSKSLSIKKQKLNNAIRLKLVLGSIKTGFSLLSLLGPKGQVVNLFGQASVDIINTVSNPHMKSTQSGPVNYDKALEDMKSYLNNHYSQKIKRIETEMQKLETKVNKETNPFLKKKENKIELIRSQIEKLPDIPSKYNLKVVFEESVIRQMILNKESKQEIEQNKKIIDEAKKKLENSEKKINTIGTIGQKAGVLVNSARIIADTFGDYQVSKSQENLIDGEIKKNADNFKGLYDLQNSVIELQETVIQEAFEKFARLLTQLEDKSIVKLEYQKMQIKNNLLELKNKITSLLKSFDSNNQLLSTIQRLDNTLERIINIYDSVEQYKEKINFTNYLSAITQTERINGIPAQYEKEINKLKKSISSNIIVELYDQALEAFDFWSFPFSCVLTQGLQTKIDADLENNDLMIQRRVDVLGQLLEVMQKSEATINYKIHNYIQNLIFDKKNPFYLWSSLNHQLEILRFLSGKSTVFYADISSAKYDAIKFSSLNLHVEILSNRSSNETLNNLIENNAMIELVHLGPSFYKFKDNVVKLDLNYKSDENIILRFRYGSRSNNDVNESFRKLETNRPILSPYTFWKMKMYPFDPDTAKEFFDRLSTVIGENHDIVIYLVGNGQYIHSELEIKNEINNCRTKRDANKNQSIISFPCEDKYEKLYLKRKENFSI